MVLTQQATNRSAFSGLVAVSICLSTMSALPIPHHSVVTWAESAEDECPSEKEREGSEKEQVVRHSQRHQLKKRHPGNFRRCHELDRRPLQATSFDDRPLGSVGHQLANGICAPLLI